MKISEIVKVTGGRLVCGDPDFEIKPPLISTDSRTIKRGSLFIALKGPNFDGADFVGDVFKKGASGAIVTAGKAATGKGKKIIIEVDDTTKALQDIAHHHRMKFNIPVVAVTGSNGKTSTKEMIWEVLSSRYKVLKNEGTKNNHIGVPQTLLSLTAKHDICVLELGTNHEGEIRALSAIARPTVAVITNIGPSHLEYLGSLEGVFRAKMEIVEYLNGDDLLIINGDDPFLASLKGAGLTIERFGFKDSNDYVASQVLTKKRELQFLVNGIERFTLNILGTHNVYNALAAIAVASHFRIPYSPMRSSFRNYKPASMRLNLKKTGGIDIIDDCYNSNPLSMKAALEALMAYPAKTKWVVSGDMLELGSHAAYLHKSLGEDIARSGVGGLITFGELSKYTFEGARAAGMDERMLWHCSSHDEMASLLKSRASKGDVILIKGSRGMRMEEVVEKLKGQGSRGKWQG